MGRPPKEGRTIARNTPRARDKVLSRGYQVKNAAQVEYKTLPPVANPWRDTEEITRKFP